MDNYGTHGRTNSLDARQRRQERIDAAALPVIFDRYCAAPYATLEDVAESLNARGIEGPRDSWTKHSVRRVILRHGLKPYRTYQREHMRNREIQAALEADRARIKAWTQSNEGIEARA